jgi:hypothetical protein
MDSTLEAQRNVEIETKTTFGNLKGADFLGPLKKQLNNVKVTKSKDGGWR